jgi:hypothetical protein
MLSDTSNPTLQMVRMTCYSSGGTWESGSCPSASRLGGCEFMESNLWFYPSTAFQTTNQVMMVCASMGGTFLPP